MTNVTPPKMERLQMAIAEELAERRANKEAGRLCSMRVHDRPMLHCASDCHQRRLQEFAEFRAGGSSRAEGGQCTKVGHLRGRVHAQKSGKVMKCNAAWIPPVFADTPCDTSTPNCALWCPHGLKMPLGWRNRKKRWATVTTWGATTTPAMGLGRDPPALDIAALPSARSGVNMVPVRMLSGSCAQKSPTLLQEHHKKTCPDTAKVRHLN